MDHRRIVVIGASAGGIDPLREIVGALPATFLAPLCVVLHTSATSPSLLSEILARASRLQVGWAEDGERLRAGRVYVAPRDHHLLVEPGVVRLGRGPKEHHFRPAINPLFRSAAQTYGPAAVGVVLSGRLDDGVSGLSVIKRLGGIAIAQDPEDASAPAMPVNAVQSVNVDHIVPASRIGPLLEEIMEESTSEIDVRTARR